MPKFQRGNVTLHYELDGSGIPAVYISGFGCHSNDLIGTLIRQSLCPQFTVLAVDNRGAGQTITGEGETVTIEDMADDIAALMEHHGISQAHMLGISMGGAIAMMLALRHPQKVKSMVVAVSLAWSKMPSRGIYMLTTTRNMRDAGISRELISRYTAVFLLSEDVFENEGLMQAWENSPVDPYQQTAQGFEQQKAAITHYDIRDQLHKINVPTLVMSSPDDLLVPPRFQDEIADGISNAEIKRYPGGHAFMVLPMYSPQFFQDVLEFWGKHSG
jgi:pimeloyl-ACP methyl ester carboxylesterase